MIMSAHQVYHKIYSFDLTIFNNQTRFLDLLPNYQLLLTEILAYNTIIMDQFETSLKRRPPRERFYSSMTHQEYVDLFGPSTPLHKPQADPLDDLPLFELEGKCDLTQDNDPGLPSIPELKKLDTILEIECSQNHTQQLNLSPRGEWKFDRQFKQMSSLSKIKEEDAEEGGSRRLRVRMRSQSDCSEYLIFNFLERSNQKGRKRVKIE